MEIIFTIFIGSLIYFTIGLIMTFAAFGFFDIEFSSENYEMHGAVIFWPILFPIFFIMMLIKGIVGLKNIFIHLSHL